MEEIDKDKTEYKKHRNVNSIDKREGEKKSSNERWTAVKLQKKLNNILKC